MRSCGICRASSFAVIIPAYAPMRPSVCWNPALADVPSLFNHCCTRSCSSPAVNETDLAGEVGDTRATDVAGAAATGTTDVTGWATADSGPLTGRAGVGVSALANTWTGATH